VEAPEVVRRAFADYASSGPLTADSRWWAKDLVLDEGGVFPDSQVICGRGAVARRLEERHALTGGRSLRLVDLEDLGDGRVLIQLVLDAVGRSSGVAFPFDWWLLVTVRDGRIAELRDFSDRESAWATASR
jgi:ketosteroid isomerase-like protein